MTSRNIRRCEMCAELPKLALHPHHVQWNFCNRNHLTVLDTTCQPLSFCDNVRCWFCTANIINPEFSLQTAVLANAVLLYITVALLRPSCHRKAVEFSAAFLCLKCVGRLINKIRSRRRKPRRRQREDIEALL